MAHNSYYEAVFKSLGSLSWCGPLPHPLIPLPPFPPLLEERGTGGEACMRIGNEA